MLRLELSSSLCFLCNTSGGVAVPLMVDALLPWCPGCCFPVSTLLEHPFFVVHRCWQKAYPGLRNNLQPVHAARGKGYVRHLQLNCCR